MENFPDYNFIKDSQLSLETKRLASQISARKRLTAVGMAVLHSNNKVAMPVDGLRKYRGSVPVITQDLWHIGSITKSVTSTLIASLVENSDLNFNANLPELLTDLKMHKSWNTCTWYNLLTHTSGLTANFPINIFKIQTKDPNELFEIREELVEKALAAPSIGKPGSKFQYSNLGYAVVGLIAEMKTNKNFEELITERILMKLGLKNSGFGAPQGENSDDQPMGHQAWLCFRRAVDPFIEPADNSPVISPAGEGCI